MRLKLDISSRLQDAVEEMAAKRGPGGARPGAGRKRIVADPERIAVDLEKPDLDALRTLAEERETSVAALIRRAVGAYLKRAKRN